MITIENVSKVYKSKGVGFYALNNVSLNIEKGDVFGIIGESGAGKSTLIRTINFLDPPTSGKIIVEGEELNKLSKTDLSKRRQNIGMIFQSFNLLSSQTVFNNIALAMKFAGKSQSEIDVKVLELLKLVNLVEKRDAYPANLSGGQKQRVAIARALSCNPHILLCDEATSALDPTTTQSILTLLKEINRELGITIVLITHEMEVIKRICNRVAVIDNGLIVEEGSVVQIFSNPQEEITKRLVYSAINVEMTDTLKQRIHKESSGRNELLYLVFTAETYDAPLISRSSKEFNVEFNILNSHLEIIGDNPFGFMLAELMGEESNRAKAMDFLKQNRVKLKVVGYV